VLFAEEGVYAYEGRPHAYDSFTAWLHNGLFVLDTSAAWCQMVCSSGQGQRGALAQALQGTRLVTALLRCSAKGWPRLELTAAESFVAKKGRTLQTLCAQVPRAHIVPNSRLPRSSRPPAAAHGSDGSTEVATAGFQHKSLTR
jgi:hypothetical protein